MAADSRPPEAMRTSGSGSGSVGGIGSVRSPAVIRLLAAWRRAPYADARSKTWNDATLRAAWSVGRGSARRPPGAVRPSATVPIQPQTTGPPALGASVRAPETAKRGPVQAPARQRRAEAVSLGPIDQMASRMGGRMTFERRPLDRAELRRRLLLSLVIAAVAIVLIAVAAVALDWTLAAGPSFDLTTDPAGVLPF